jgi:hypothetical protein
MSKLPSRLAGACSAVLAATLLAVPGLASATGIKIYSYAAKLVCEEEEGNEVETSVNIHNPSLTLSADYKVKVVIPDEGFYFVADDHLYADRATSIECEDLESVSGAPGIDISDFEGFLVVLSKRPLDVVGVYEVDHTGDGEQTEDLDVVVYSPQVGTYALSVWNGLINYP